MDANLPMFVGMTIVGSLAAVGFFTMCTTAVVVEGRKDRRKMEIEHERRMKALQLGQTLPEDRRAARTPKSPGVSLGLGTVSIALPIAFVSGMVLRDPETPWIVAGLVSVASIVCGTILTLFGPKPSLSETSTQFASQPKPAVEDADAIDLVGSRA